MAGANATVSYYSVFEEISKNSVQLNYAERLWAVRRQTFPTKRAITSFTSITANECPSSRLGTYGCRMTPLRPVS